MATTETKLSTQWQARMQNSGAQAEKPQLLTFKQMSFKNVQVIKCSVLPETLSDKVNTNFQSFF